MSQVWHPEAIIKRLSKYERSRPGQPNAFILHVAVSESDSLYGIFNNRGTCSHFYVRRDGKFEQYLPISSKSAADYQGNYRSVSAETQGGLKNANSEKWTPQQLVTLAKLARWLHEEHGLSLNLMDSSKPTEHGIGWHRLGIDGYFPPLPNPGAGREERGGGEKWSLATGKLCPGLGKISQVDDIAAMARAGLPDGGGSSVPTPPKDPSSDSRNWLQEGDGGPKVRELQTLLNKFGYGLTVDGRFGAKTENAVRSFQSRHGLVIDGLAGPKTLEKLRTTTPPNLSKPKNLKKGSTGTAVKRLQRQLNKFGYGLKVDGTFGPATESAVRRFQKRFGLTIDGIVGPSTQGALDTEDPGPTLKIGSRGGQVKELQRLLNRKFPTYSRLLVDGIYGRATAGVVKEFQRTHHLVQDGIVGPKTRAALGL